VRIFEVFAGPMPTWPLSGNIRGISRKVMRPEQKKRFKREKK
jgi:hypothetical protein